MNFLIIDDDDEDREILSEALTSLFTRARISTADNANAALKITSVTSDFDYIFLDGKLPGISCEDCLRSLRTLPTLGKVPIVIYSGYAPHDISDKLISLGATKFIGKSASFDELVRQLQLLFAQNVSY